MDILKNFTQQITVDRLNGELSSVHAELIDIVRNGAEGVELYFSRCNGCVDCLRLSAQRGPHGGPALCVEYLPYSEDDAAESPAEGADDAENVPPLAVWDSVHGGYYLADAVKNTVIDPGPFPAEIVEDWTGVQIVGGPAAEDADEDEEDTEE